MTKPITAPRMGSSLPPSSQDRVKKSKVTDMFTPSKRIPVIDQTRVNKDVMKAAKGLEAMFMDYMVQVMRKSVPKSDLIPRGMAEDIYQGMYDSEVVKKATDGLGTGLALRIVANLDPSLYNYVSVPKSLKEENNQGEVNEDNREHKSNK